MTENKKYYIKDAELWKELKISKGKGKRTKRLDELLILIAENSYKVLGNKYIGNDRHNDEKLNNSYDIYAGGLTHILSEWKGFNCDKYSVSLPYIVEVCKRSFTHNFNLIVLNKKNWYDESYTMLRIDDFLEYKNSDRLW